MVDAVRQLVDGDLSGIPDLRNDTPGSICFVDEDRPIAGATTIIATSATSTVVRTSRLTDFVIPYDPFPKDWM